MIELVTGRTEQDKRKRRLCLNKRCRNKARIRKRGKKVIVNSLCRKCETQQYRERYPLKTAYQGLKDRAKKRKIPFTITLNYFKKFCFKNNYLVNRPVGRENQTADDLTIDRKNPLKGYVPGNLQIMTRAENSAKQAKDYSKYGKQTWAEPPIDTSDIVRKPPAYTDEDVPF